MYEKRPWLRGIIENIYAADLIRNTSLENRNRISLILLDTALEIAFKYYLQFEIPQPVKVEKQWSRDTLHKAAKNKTKLDNDIWVKINYFYDIRCDLYHESAGKTIMPSDLNDFHKLVQVILIELFDVPSEAFDVDPKELITKTKKDVFIPINSLKLLEQIVVVVKKKLPKSSTEIRTHLKQMGTKKVPTASNITAYMNNKSYSHLFHYEGGVFYLTEFEGERVYRDIEGRFESRKI